MVGFWDAYKAGKHGDASGLLRQRSKEKEQNKDLEEYKEFKTKQDEDRHKKRMKELAWHRHKERNISAKERRLMARDEERRKKEEKQQTTLKGFKNKPSTKKIPVKRNIKQGGGVKVHYIGS